MNRASYLGLVLIIAVALALLFILFSGPFYSFDDMNYITYAHQMLSGTFNVQESPYAYGFFTPMFLALSFWLFGVGVFASVYPSAIRYIVLIVLGFLCGRKLYDDNFGLVVAFVIATAPFLVGYSTRVLPDIGTGVCAALSITLFAYASATKRGNVLYFLSGAAAALSIYFKFVGLLLALFFLMSLFVYRFFGSGKRRSYSSIIFPFAGLLAVCLLYATALAILGANPINSFTAYGQNQATISPTNMTKNIGTMETMLAGYSSPYYPFGPVADPQTFPLGLITLYAIAGMAFAIKKRDRLMAMLSVITWGIFLYLFFGSVTLTAYNLITVVSRYFILIVLPMSVLAAYAVYNFCSYLARRYRKAATALLLALLIVSYIPAYLTLHNYNSSIAGDTRTFYAALNYMHADSGNRPVELLVNGNSSALYASFLSSYSANTDVIAMNTTQFAKARNQVSAMCNQTTENRYLMVVYDNYSKGMVSAIFSSWISPYCNFTRIGSFYDNRSEYSVYNGMNVRIDLYRFG